MEPDDKPLLLDADLVKMTGEKRQTWRKRRLTGLGPAFIRIGRKAAYRREDVDAWLNARRYTSTTAENAAKTGASETKS